MSCNVPRTKRQKKQESVSPSDHAILLEGGGGDQEKASRTEVTKNSPRCSLMNIKTIVLTYLRIHG